LGANREKEEGSREKQAIGGIGRREKRGGKGGQGEIHQQNSFGR